MLNKKHDISFIFYVCLRLFNSIDFIATVTILKCANHAYKNLIKTDREMYLRNWKLEKDI